MCHGLINCQKHRLPQVDNHQKHSLSRNLAGGRKRNYLFFLKVLFIMDRKLSWKMYHQMQKGKDESLSSFVEPCVEGTGSSHHRNRRNPTPPPSISNSAKTRTSGAVEAGRATLRHWSPSQGGTSPAPGSPSPFLLLFFVPFCFCCCCCFSVYEFTHRLLITTLHKMIWQWSADLL